MAKLNTLGNLASVSGDTDLETYLDLSWFYPEGFQKEGLIQGVDSVLALGRDIAYRFPMVASPLLGCDPEISFNLALHRARNEIKLNSYSAPEIYLGLRFLHWVDDEPLWLSQTGVDVVPQNATTLAVVMRRIREEYTLQYLLSHRSEIPDQYLRLLAKRLTYFHKMSSAVVDGRSLDQYEKRLFHFASGSLDEMQALVGRQIRLEWNHFKQRLLTGSLVHKLGDFSLKSVLFLETEFGLKACIRRRAWGDVGLAEEDLVKLSVMIEQSGNLPAAKRLEELYFREAEWPRSRVYDLLKAVEIVKAKSVALCDCLAVLANLRNPVKIIFCEKEWETNRNVIIEAGQLGSSLGMLEIVVIENWKNSIVASLLRECQQSGTKMLIVRTKPHRNSDVLTYCGRGLIREYFASPTVSTLRHVLVSCVDFISTSTM